jgi:hypothetical protein
MGAFMAAVTGSEGGGNYGRLKRGELLGWRSLGLPGMREGGGWRPWRSAREEEVALDRRGEGGRRPNRPTACWADRAES